MSFRNKESKILELLRTPPGLAIAFCCVGFIVVITFLLIRSLSGQTHKPEVPSELDPASGETLYLYPYTDDPPNGPAYIGFETLSKNGLTPSQFQVFKKTIESYAKENSIDLTRVSYLKDSYKLRASYVFDFKIVLNIDETELKVEVDSSKGWKDVLGAKVTIWQGDIEVYAFEVTDNNICDFRDVCYYEDDGT